MRTTIVYEVYDVSKGKPESGQSYGFYGTKAEANQRIEALAKVFVDKELGRYSARAEQNEVSQRQVELLVRNIAKVRYGIRKGETVWMPKAA